MPTTDPQQNFTSESFLLSFNAQLDLVSSYLPHLRFFRPIPPPLPLQIVTWVHCAMPRQAKRSRVAAGLAADEAGSSRPTKSARHPSSAYSSQPSAHGSSQPSSIAASSQPSSSATVQASPDAVQPSSWRTPGDEDGEPCTQDLTQSDDGLAHELYGSLGMHVGRVDMRAKADHRQRARLWA